MVFLFKDKSIGSVFALILLALVVHLHIFFNPIEIVQNEQSGFISYWLSHYGGLLNQTLLAVIYITILLIQAIRFNLILNELRMYHVSGFTTAMAYILLSGFFTQFFTFSAAIIANFFLMIVFIQLSKLYNDTKPKITLFNTGILVGISLLGYHPTSLLIAIVLLAVALIRPFNISEWFVLLLGVLMPIYLTISVLYLTNSLHLVSQVLPNLTVTIPIQQTDMFFWIAIVLTAIQLIYGMNIWSSQNSRMVIQIRKNWGVLIVMLLILLPIPFVFVSAGVKSFILFFIPLSAFIANAYLYPKKSLFPNLLLGASLLFVLYNNWVLIKK